MTSKKFISVIIPTFKEPDALDLCLKSAIDGQEYKGQNEIIVVVDGFYDLNKEILKKYKEDIEVLNLEKNYGLAKATNLGVYNASSQHVLIVNDDNVFPHSWDRKLYNYNKFPNTVLAPNQIEPFSSIFKQFVIEDLGRDPKTFDLEQFWEYEELLPRKPIDNTGSTLPIFIDKYDYLKVGGWDESYPWQGVVDWEFFMKCQLSGMKMYRSYDVNFYHFVSLGTKTPEQADSSRKGEQECHEYFKYKWGFYAQTHPETNSKVPSFLKFF